MNSEILIKYIPILLKGCLNTILLTFTSIFFGVLLALIIVLFKVSKNKILNYIGTFYTWFFRGIPLLILLFIIYFGFPDIGIKFTSFEAAAIGLSINISAYLAEAIRGALLSINSNQWEAAQTEGMSFFQTVFYIIFPQSLSRMLPSINNEFIALIKDTALVSTISMVDLMSTSQKMANTSFKPLEIFFLAALLYLAMTTFFTSLFNFIERKVDFNY